VLGRLKNGIERLTGMRTLLLLGAVVLAFFLFFNASPWGVAKMRQYAHVSAAMLDVRLHYTPDEAYTLLASLGSDGRHYYLFLLRFDFVFPAFYGVFLAAILVALSRRVCPPASWMQWIFLAPLAAAICDYAENAGILRMLLAYPRRLTTVAAVTGIFTTTKWIFSGIAVLSIATLGFTLLWRSRMHTSAAQKR
jgi:hypothetical protein